MGKLRAVIAREYLERVRTRWFLVATVFGPLLFAAMILIPTLLASRTLASEQATAIVILDATGVSLGARVASRLVHAQSDTGLAQVRIVQPAELAAAESLSTREVIERRATGYLVLDAQTLAGQRARYAGRDASSLPVMERLETAVHQAVIAHRLASAGVDPNRIDELTRLRLRMTTERITERGRGGSGMVSFLFAFGLAFYLYFALILYGQNVLRGVMEEKQTRVAEVVISSVSPNTLLAGKVIGVGAVGLTQLLIWTVSGMAIFRLREPLLARLGVPAMPLQFPDLSVGVGLLLLLFFLLGFTFYAALFAAVGAMVSSEQEAQQAAQPVMLLIIASVIFMQPILLDPTGRLAIVMSILPFSSPILMPMRLSVVPVPLAEIAGSVAALAAGCAAAVWLASRIYRVGLLMHGKRPTVRELVRWVLD